MAFVLTLALVVARAMMSEVVREAMEVSPNSTAFPRAPGPGTTLFLNALCCLPALLVLVRRAIDKPYRLRASWSHALLGLAAGWSAVSVAWSADKFTAIVYASSFIAAAVLAWSTTQLVRSWARLRVVAGAAVGLLLVYAAHGIVYRFVDVADNRAYWQENKQQILWERGWAQDSFEARQFERKLVGGEMIGFHTSPNSFAAVIVMLVTIAAGAAVQRRAGGDAAAWSLAIAVPSLAVFIVLYLTNTRTAAGTLLLAALLMASLASSRLRAWLGTHSRLAYSIGAFAVVLGVGAVVAHGVYHGSLPNASLNFRWRYWVAGWRLFTEHPLLGVGWGNFANYYTAARVPAAAEEVRDPHNFVVRAFVELGVVGGVLVIAWIARAAWELTRPIVPPVPAPLASPSIAAAAASDVRPAASPAASSPPSSSPTSASSSSSSRRAVLTILAIAAGGVAINALASVDFNQSGAFLTLELFRRFLALGLLCVAMLLVVIRSAADQSIDDRPAPWLLYAALAGLAAFMVHNMVDFVLAEPGPAMLFAAVLGAALGVRAPSRAGAEPRRTLAIAALAAAGIAWIAAMMMLVIPVVDAEGRAHVADDHVRRGRPELAHGMYAAAFAQVPRNADYAFRAARALVMAGADAERTRAMLGIAIATEPTNVSYRLTRAGLELKQESPDFATVRRDYDAAVRLDPHGIAARLEYAAVLERLGDPAAAAAQYRGALATNGGYDATEPKRLPPARVGEIERKIAQLEASSTSPPPGTAPADAARVP